MSLSSSWIYVADSSLSNASKDLVVRVSPSAGHLLGFAGLRCRGVTHPRSLRAPALQLALGFYRRISGCWYRRCVSALLLCGSSQSTQKAPILGGQQIVHVPSQLGQISVKRSSFSA